jgi:hypothetical protein
MNSRTSAGTDDGPVKWGFAIAGAIAIGFAALIQLAFDGLDAETLATLPAMVAILYGIAGKLGVTIPLAVLGFGLILRDVLGNRNTGTGVARPVARLAHISRTSKTKSAAVSDAGECQEVGEPLAEEAPAPAAVAQPARKIAAVAGGFGGRGGSAQESIPGKTGGPVGDSTPLPQRSGSGQMVLSSAKYLNRDPGASFRRGTTHHTRNE